MKIETSNLGVEEISRVYKRKGFRRFLHSILPDGLYSQLRGWRIHFFSSAAGKYCFMLASVYLRLLSYSGILSALHYVFFSRQFDREHKAVLASRSKHLRDIYSGNGNLFMLRRNIHRLEKGLIMKPPRPIFGLDKIEETVTAYKACLAQSPKTRGELNTTLEWAKCVLDIYFKRVSSHPVIDRAKANFIQINDKVVLQSNTFRAPFLREPPPDLPTIEQLESLARFRRSVRWFSAKPVSRDLIDRAVQVALESPTACNRQPFRFEIFDQPDLVQLVGAIPKGTPGWLHQIPVFIVVIGKFDAFRFERDRHVPYIDGCLSAMGLIYALEVQGISSCCVNFPDFAETERRMAETLGLPPWERAIMCLAAGYPDLTEKVPFSQKLPLEVIRNFNMLRKDRDITTL